MTMKSIVLGIMKYRLFLIFAFCGIALSLGQVKEEKEQRIPESVFPKKALTALAPYLENVRRLRYYREQDGHIVSYECKFKKDRLYYSIEFDSVGQLEDVEFLIEDKDIPDKSWDVIAAYLNEKYNLKRIKKIQQQYPLENETAQQLLSAAFKNILIPKIRYEVVIHTKEENGYVDYELLFTASGAFVKERRVVNSKYDHVLY